MGAYNGSGTFVRSYDWTTDEGNGINIEASRMDTEDDGFATGLSTCITKDGQTTITANIPFGTNKITGLGNGSARTDSIALGQVQDGTYLTLGTLGGSADTYTATPSPVITAYATGSEYNLKVNADNTGASTLNVSAIGAKDIKKYDGAGAVTALEAGDLQQDQYYKVIYDGTQFVVLNPQKPYIDIDNIVLPAATPASDSVAGVSQYATQAEQETGSSTTRIVTPGRQHYHPSSAKAWVKFDGTGTLSVVASYNVSSVTDNGTGNYTVNLTNAMSSASYAVASSCSISNHQVDAFATTSFRVLTRASSGTLTDSPDVCAVVFGDQ